MTVAADKAETMSVRADSLSKRFVVARNLFGRPTSQLHAVTDVSFSIPNGATLALVGESGSGKSTTARMVARLEQPDAGKVHVLGADWTALKGRELRRHRPRMQMVFQDPYASLNPMKMVVFNVGEPLIVHRQLRGAELDAEVRRLLDLVQLPPSILHRYPHEFSGGQRQRLAIARALATDPDVIIADEAVSALDVSTQAQVLNLLQDIKRGRQLSMLFISHDLGVVRQVADQVAVMFLGRIVESGDADQVFDNPLHPYTRELLAAVPRVGRRAQQAAVERVVEPPSPTNLPPGCPFASRCPLAIQRCRDVRPALSNRPHAVACHVTGEDPDKLPDR